MRLIFLSIAALVFCLYSTQGISAEKKQSGAEIYESLKCGACHKPDVKAAGSSLAEIAKAYQSKDKLVAFMKGESKPVMGSEKWGMMKGQLPKLTALGEEQKEALADYVLSFK